MTHGDDEHVGMLAPDLVEVRRDRTRLEEVVGAHDRDVLGGRRREPGVERAGGAAHAVREGQQSDPLARKVREELIDHGDGDLMADDRDPEPRIVDHPQHRGHGASHGPLRRVHGDDHIEHRVRRVIDHVGEIPASIAWVAKSGT